MADEQPDEPAAADEGSARPAAHAAGARLAMLRDELAGLATRLDLLERRAEESAARADTAEQRLGVGDALGEVQLESIEGLNRSASAVLQQVDAEVARTDRLDDRTHALVLRLDGMESQLLRIAGRADGNASEIEELAKRLTVAEDSTRSLDLRLGILESRDEEGE